MFSNKMAEAISYLIGVVLAITIFFIAKRKQALPEKKIVGFPLSKIAVALAVYFLAMALWAYFK